MMTITTIAAIAIGHRLSVRRLTGELVICDSWFIGLLAYLVYLFVWFIGVLGLLVTWFIGLLVYWLLVHWCHRAAGRSCPLFMRDRCGALHSNAGLLGRLLAGRAGWLLLLAAACWLAGLQAALSDDGGDDD